MNKLIFALLLFFSLKSMHPPTNLQITKQWEDVLNKAISNISTQIKNQKFEINNIHEYNNELKQHFFELCKIIDKKNPEYIFFDNLVNARKQLTNSITLDPDSNIEKRFHYFTNYAILKSIKNIEEKNNAKLNKILKKKDLDPEWDAKKTLYIIQKRQKIIFKLNNINNDTLIGSSVFNNLIDAEQDFFMLSKLNPVDIKKQEMFNIARTAARKEYDETLNDKAETVCAIL